MKIAIRSLLVLVAALGLVGSVMLDARAGDDGKGPIIVAQDEPPPADTPPGETDTPPSDAATLSEDDKKFVSIASHVACYNTRISDISEANAAIVYYLKQEGMSLEHYKELEEKYRSNEAVQDALKKEIDNCATYVLMMPSDEEPVEDPEVVEETEVKEWSWKKKTYTAGGIGSGGVSGGKITLSFSSSEKFSVNFSGKHDGKNFTLGGSGKRKKDSASTSMSSGKNSGTLSCDWEKTEKDNEIKYKEADCKFSGTINGKSVSFSTTLKVK